ncbi:thiolase family protein [Rubrobacter indicoceani]|uniref:thiolase family protein n=1 Tax=Rubrobacter indicoceani TaxID=2051957 RepID=UPI000E5A269B|nr:thiolase family protein [Rubrobacter indicoceani]
MPYSSVTEAWIVEAVRTPVGRHGGALASVRPDDLGAMVLEELMSRAGIDRSEVEDVYFGCTNGVGEDSRNVARMSALLAGFPEKVSGVTVNRLCGSGLQAVSDASRALMLGEAEVYVAGGVETMSRAPWAMPKPERGYPVGAFKAEDTALGWRFVNPKMEAMGHTDSLGQTAENLAEEMNLTREEQDEFALRSHEKAVAATKSGRLKSRIVPVKVNSGKTETTVESDEGPRPDSTMEKLSKLRPAFRKGGSVTAGNSSPLNDGAAALLIVSKGYAERNGLAPLARIKSLAVAGVPPRTMGIGPVPATAKALDRAGLTLDDIGLIELNEAFAAQSLAVLREWGVDPADRRLNPNGGAIAIGHPLGCSGARILTDLLHEMKLREDVRYGLATMCIGVGQGISVIVEKA